MLAKQLGIEWNYGEFKDKFFQEKYLGTRVVYVPRDDDDIEDDVAKLVNHIGSTVKIEDCADIPAQTFIREDFKLSEAQERAKKSILEVNPIVRFTKYHQIESCALKSDGYTDNMFYKCDKVDRIKDICANNKKVAIICRYNLQIDLLKKELEKDKRKVYVIRGEVKNRDEIIQKVESSDEAVILINASISEGYEIPSIGVCVFASMSFSYKDYKQIIGRFLRLNKLNKNVYIHLVSEGVDEAVYDSIMKKQDFSIAIYEKEN